MGERNQTPYVSLSVREWGRKIEWNLDEKNDNATN